MTGKKEGYMIQHLVKCEICDTQFELHPMERPIRSAPEGWLTLFHMKDIQAQEGWHFCSLHCLFEWSAQKDEPLPAPESPYIAREEGA